MLDLLDHPLWRPEDLGRPIPDSPHAVSVCLPTWRDNIGYEENDPRVHSRLATGYPRFVYNQICRDLFEQTRARFARDGEACLAFPAAGPADRLCRALHDWTGHRTRPIDLGRHGAHAVLFPREHASLAKSVWQHCGEGISSRHAEACLTADPAPPQIACGLAPPDGDSAKQTLRQRIARLVGVPADHVFLFPCGMNALFTLHRALLRLCPGRSSVQFGFPYVDSLKVQQKFGPGARFFPSGCGADLERLTALMDREPVSALYTEFPSNPLLTSPDLDRLAQLARRHGAPLVVDDTLAGFTNADLLPVADVLATSLTKFFSGAGDVTAGSLAVNPRSPFAADLLAALRDVFEDLLWPADAIVLERNSRDYESRMPRINHGAEALADFLHSHPAVAEVHYPKFQTPDAYRPFLRPGGGYSGLLSFTLRDAPRRAPQVFDALRVSKGPNLGTSYTLACPYTLLAHYTELDFAESCGVSRHLIRVSVGLEDPEDLIDRFHTALAPLP